MISQTEGLLRIRDTAVAAVERAFETMNEETGKRLLAGLNDPEKALSVVVWLSGPRIDICSIPADPDQPPEIMFSTYCGN